MPDELMSVEIKGLDEMLLKMEQLPAEINRKCVKESLEAGGAVLFGAIEALTPIRTGPWTGGDSLRDGELKAALKTKTFVAGGTDSTISTATVGFRDTAAKAFGSVANHVELGHKLVAHGGRATKSRAAVLLGDGKVPAHPFIRPAFDESANRAVEAFTATMKLKIETEIANLPDAASG